MDNQRKVSQITKDLVKFELYKAKKKLVEFHILHVNPSYINGHVMVASKVIDDKFLDMSSYKAECKRYGISYYEGAFQSVLHIIRKLKL